MMKQLVMHVQFEYPAMLRVLESFHIICLIYLQVLPCAEPPREEADAVGLAVEAMESVSVIICCSVYALGSGAKMQYCMLRNVLCIVFFLRCKAPAVEPLPEDAGDGEHKARLDCCATVAMCTTCVACTSNAAID